MVNKYSPIDEVSKDWALNCLSIVGHELKTIYTLYVIVAPRRILLLLVQNQTTSTVLLTKPL